MPIVEAITAPRSETRGAPSVSRGLNKQFKIAAGTSIVCGGIAVSPGDLVVGDEDGGDGIHAAELGVLGIDDGAIEA